MEDIAQEVIEKLGSKLDSVVAFFETMFRQQLIIELGFSLTIFIISLSVLFFIQRIIIKSKVDDLIIIYSSIISIIAAFGSLIWFIYHGMIALFNPNYYAFIQLIEIIN